MSLSGTINQKMNAENQKMNAENPIKRKRRMGDWHTISFQELQENLWDKR